MRDGDLELINSPIDFLGVNYYTPAIVGAHPVPGGTQWPGLTGVHAHPHTEPKTAMGWQVEPESLTNLLLGHVSTSLALLGLGAMVLGRRLALLGEPPLGALAW